MAYFIEQRPILGSAYGPELSETSTPDLLVERRRVSPNVSVVIPTLNEAENLPHVLTRIPDCVNEVILVDGHSTDGTTAVARQIRPDIRIIYQTGRGKGNALACGFRECSGNVIVMLDADGSTDQEEIPRYVEALRRGADFAKGSRFLEGGGSDDITGFRSLGNHCLRQLVNTLFKSRYTDLCYGYNAFWAHCLPVMNVDCDGFEVETLINVRVARAGLRVVEVPSYEFSRIHGVSNLNAFRDGRRVLSTIVREFFRPARRTEEVMGTAYQKHLEAEDIALEAVAE